MKIKFFSGFILICILMAGMPLKAIAAEPPLLKLPYPNSVSCTITNGYEDGMHKNHKGDFFDDRYALDFDFHGTNLGKPICTVAPGVIHKVTFWDGTTKGYGNSVIVDHDNGYYSRYAHLDKIYVKEGERVHYGYRLGECGNTGCSNNNTTGNNAHLHFAMYHNGKAYRPEPMSNYPTFASNSGPYISDNQPKIRWHPDGTLVKDPIKNRIYVLENSTKRYIPGPSIFKAWRYNEGKIITVSPEEIQGYPTGSNLHLPPAGYPDIKNYGTTKVFLIEDGKKRHILSEQVLYSWGYKWSDRVFVGSGSLNFPSGEPVVYRDGTLIYATPSGNVYVVSNKILWHIEGMETFNALGYNMNNKIDVSDSALTNGALGICPKKINMALITSQPGNNTCPKVTICPVKKKIISGSQQKIPFRVFDKTGDLTVELWQTFNDWIESKKIKSSTVSVHSATSDEYPWTVPNVATDEGELCIVAYDESGNVGCSYSGQFSIALAGSPPATPELYDQGGYREVNYYTIFWEEVSDATSYTLQESTDSSFTNNRVEYSTTVPSQYITGKGNGFYYYRVRANNSEGSSGWSNITDMEVRVNAPPYISNNPNPSDGATNVSRKPTLSWTGGDSDGTVDYAVRFGKDSGNIVCIKGFGKENTYQVNYDLDPGTTYYWQIMAKDNKGLETIGPLWRFTTAYSCADLIPTSLVVNGSITPNAQVTLNLTVKNQGTYPAPWGQVLFYYSSSSGAKEQRLHRCGVSFYDLAPGSQTTISQTVTLENLKAGKSYIDAWIDTQNCFIEGDIDNNTLSYELDYLDNNSPVISYFAFQQIAFKAGYEYPIVFKVSDDIGVKNLDFYYSTDNGLTWKTIATGFVSRSSWAGDSYKWKIPSDVPPTNQLKIKMVAWDTEMNMSKAVAGQYKIIDGTPPTVKIISPNGGEVWNLGSQHEIKWEVSVPNGIGMMDLWLSCGDSGEYISDIRTNTTGCYTWTLPKSSSFVTNGAKIKIKVRDINGNESEDWSDGYFSINDPSLPPLPPWTMPEKVTSVPSINWPYTSKDHYHPVVATDKFGNLHMVYKYTQDDNSGGVNNTGPQIIKQEILYKKFSNGFWSNPTTVYSLTQETDGNMRGCHNIGDLQIAVDSNGYPHIAWTDSPGGPITYCNQEDIYYTYFNGSIWTTPQNVSNIAKPLDFTWTAKANMPETTRHAASGMVNGKIYVFGNSTYEYNPAGGTWTRKADLSNNGYIEGGGATVINNKIYAIGDYRFDNNNNIKIYDPANDSWSTGANLPTSRRLMGVCTVNGKLYAIGGGNSTLSPYNTVEEYNPITGSWTTKKSMPTARYSPAVAVVNNLIYVFGGWGDGSDPLDTVEVYNPSTDSWSTKTTMPTRCMGAVAEVINGKIYVIGGNEYNNYLNIVEQYDPATDRWNCKTSMTTPRIGAVSEVIGNKVYVIGGEDGNNSLSVVEEGILTGEDVEQTVSYSPKIAIDSSDNVHVVWQDGYSWNSDNTITGQSNLYHRSKNNSGQWSSISQLTTGEAWSPSAVFDKNDNLHLAYCIGTQSIAYIKWNGNSWSNPMTVTTSASGQIDLVADNNNYLHMAWYYWPFQIKINQILYSYYNGSIWSSPEEVSDKIPGHHPFRPSIVVDSLGYPHIIWKESGDKYRLKYKRKTPQGWSSAIQLNTESQSVEGHSSNATISQNDQIHTVWTSSHGGHQEVFYNHANALAPIGDTIPPVVNLLTPTGEESLSIGSTYSITWNASDNIGVSSISLKYTTDGGTTFTEIATGESNDGIYQWTVPSISTSTVQIWIIALDPSGKQRVNTSGNFSISDQTLPVVSVITPDGGELWESESQHNIIWSATDNVGVSSINLFYSVNGGSDWLTIATGETNDGSYTWTVPYNISTNCKIKLTAYDSNNNIGSDENNSLFQISSPNKPPFTPHNPIPPDNSSGVFVNSKLEWQGGDPDSKDAVNYEVYLGTATSSMKMVSNNLTETFYNHGSLTSNNTYYWQITACDSIGTSSSPIWSFTTGDEPVNAPTNLSGVAVSSSQINLFWTDNSDNEVCFKVERKLNTEENFTEIATVIFGTTTNHDMALNGNTVYIYRVRASAAHGTSTYSNEVAVTTQNSFPYIPFNPIPADNSTDYSINPILSWSGGDPDSGNTVVYDVYFGSSTNPPLVSLGQTRTTFVPENLTYLKYYFWKVVAKDSYGVSSTSQVWSFITKVEPVPNAPDNLSVTTLSGTCTTLFWTDNSDNDIAFKVECKAGINGNYNQIIETDTPSYKDEEVKGNTTYYYRVKAYNKSGDSKYSNEANVKTPNNAPNIPGNPLPSNGATAQPINVFLIWTGSDPDTEDTVTYDVYFGTSTMPPLVSSNQGETFYNPGTLSYNTTCYWKVVATDNHNSSVTGSDWSFTTEVEVTSSISVTSTPTGADIYFDGTNTGTITPAILTGIIPDDHTVKLTKAGYYDWTGSVTVTAGTTTDVIASLTLMIGSISITSTPAGANIYLDGTSTGMITPAILTNIIPGDHTLKLTKAGYYDWSDSVTVTAGTTTDVYGTFFTPIMQKGFSYTAWWHNSYNGSQSDTSLENLKKTGTEWVSLLVTWYQETKTSTTIYNDSNRRTPDDTGLIQAINKIHASGMKVMLKPHVDCQDGSWRGGIEPSDWGTWFTSYGAFINHYAELAQQNNVEQFCIGCELEKAVLHQAKWREIISGIRGRFNGALTYAANWDSFDKVGFWDVLDYAGIDGYFPLTLKNNPSSQGLIDVWKDKWLNKITTWQTTINKPVLFTEVGYRSIDGANKFPYEWTGTGTVDLQEQADCYEAVFQVFWDKPWFYGTYWWNWDTDPNQGGAVDLNYTPHNKLAENVLCGWYKGLSNNGIISIASIPPGADIYLDGTNTGSVTPAALTGIIPGTYIIKLILSGYDDWVESVTVAAGQTSYIHGSLFIDTIPPKLTILYPSNGAIFTTATQTITGTVTGTTLNTGTLTFNGIESQIDITGGTFTKEIILSPGENIVKVSAADAVCNIGTNTIRLELVALKETILPGAEGEGIGASTSGGLRIEILDNPFEKATATITINDNPEKGNLALVIDAADAKNDPRINIPATLKKAVYEFKLVQGEDIAQGTETSGRFKITIPYPAAIPDDTAKDLRIYWLNPNTNYWELVGGTVDTINHTVTVEVTHFSIYRIGILVVPPPKKIIVYPNPTNKGWITFSGLTELVKVRIFNIAGELVYGEHEHTTDGEWTWDCRNNAGEKVASGTYIYIIQDPASGGIETGKLGMIK